jgi:hypothetical protein
MTPVPPPRAASAIGSVRTGAPIQGLLQVSVRIGELLQVSVKIAALLQVMPAVQAPMVKRKHLDL